MSEINFNNTEVAFANKSNGQLKKAKLLFMAFNYPFIIKWGPKIAVLLVDRFAFVKKLIKNTLFAQFCGGENIQDCKQSIEVLHSSKIGTILDYSVEGEEEEIVFDATKNEIIATIKKASENPDKIPFSVFKTTGITRIGLLTKMSDKLPLNQKETLELIAFKNRFESICHVAAENGVQLFVDAEETWIQSYIDEITYEMMMKFNKEKAIVFNTIQAYRLGRVEHVRNKINELTCFLGFKIVRGAYMEKERERAKEMGYESPIQPTKAATDLEYNTIIELCVSNINRVSICAGTHNEESSQLLIDLMGKNNLEKQHPNIYFAQLLGMSDHISYNVANAGYNVAKYVPYGPVKAVLPYLSRRAEENSSVKGQVGRELNLINLELKRRKA